MRFTHILLVFLFLSTSLIAENKPILPPPLLKGELIALVFPASYLNKSVVEGQKIVERKEKWLQLQGYKTIRYPMKINLYGYLAGQDSERASALMAAWRNPDVKAIWCFRGGYGTSRLLDFLDYAWIKSHPKILIGMSDITALHHAIHQKTGLVTYLGPVLNYFMEDSPDFNETYAFLEWRKTVSHQSWRQVVLPQNHSLTRIRPGKAQGALVGGNLTLIASLCGTKWQLDTTDKILVLEDIGEEIYRLDRMLWQLRESGLLNQPAGVILGSWTECKSSSKNSLTLDDVMNDYFGDADYPVIANFPTGHGVNQTTLPLNAKAELDADNLKLTVRVD